MKKYIFLSLAILAVSFAHGQTSKHALFIGNSYVSVNDLPQLISDIATSMGDTLTYNLNTPGGCTFREHCQNQSMTLIRQGGWDVVVLQEQSQYPSFPDFQVESEVFPYAKQLVDSVYAASPCAEPMFYMTWGRKNGDQHNASAFPPLGTYRGMDSLLALRYQMMADANDAALCPVGRVWRWLRTYHPEIELYQSDESHPSAAGSYAAACAFYTLIFHRNPDLVTFEAVATLSPEEARHIRQAVKTVVYDSLDRWQRPQPQIQTIVADTSMYLSFSLQLQTLHCDSLSVQWGDGFDTLLPAMPSMVLRHTYAAPGDYSIAISATRHCMAAAASLSFAARQEPSEPEGINAAAVPVVTLSPNPADKLVRLTFNAKPSLLEVYDAAGRLLECHRPQGADYLLPVRHLPAGTYVLRYAVGGAAANTPLVVTH